MRLRWMRRYVLWKKCYSISSGSEPIKLRETEFYTMAGDALVTQEAWNLAVMIVTVPNIQDFPNHVGGFKLPVPSIFFQR